MGELIDIHDPKFQRFVVHNFPIVLLAELMRAYHKHIKDYVAPISQEEIDALYQALDKFGDS